jgi:elongation factor G
MNPEGNGTTIIEAEVPQFEMLKYATDLRSITQGRGSYTLEFDHYEEVPNHMLDRVVKVKETEE